MQFVETNLDDFLVEQIKKINERKKSKTPATAREDSRAAAVRAFFEQVALGSRYELPLNHEIMANEKQPNGAVRGERMDDQAWAKMQADVIFSFHAALNANKGERLYVTSPSKENNHIRVIVLGNGDKHISYDLLKRIDGAGLLTQKKREEFYDRYAQG